jgi:hypothetical protein
MISDFSRILAFNSPGYFGQMYSERVWKGQSQMIETIDLSLQGTMAFYYVFIYKEPFPVDPTYDQQENINKIWVNMGHPENVVIQ